MSWFLGSQEALGEILRDSDSDDDDDDEDDDDDDDDDGDNNDMNGSSSGIRERHKGFCKNGRRKINMLDTKQRQKAMNIKKEAGTPVSCYTKYAVRKNPHSAPPDCKIFENFCLY